MFIDLFNQFTDFISHTEGFLATIVAAVSIMVGFEYFPKTEDAETL